MYQMARAKWLEGQMGNNAVAPSGFGGWLTVAGMFVDWVTGRGPETRTFGEGTPQVADMKSAPGIAEARSRFYQKNAHAIECRCEPLQPVTDIDARFGL